MKIKGMKSLSLLLSGAILLTACSPYIYDPQEYNRDRADYGRPLKDRTQVRICYFTRTTTPQDILAMAEAECGKFNKSARYVNTQVGECPLATPALANFACEAR